MCLCYHDYNHYHYCYHHYCCLSHCCYQYYYHHHVIVIITIIIIILGIFNHQCMWTYYYKIRCEFAMMWQIAAFKYIFNWYLHPGIYSSMEYSITWWHKLCRAFTLDALASRPVACHCYYVHYYYYHNPLVLSCLVLSCLVLCNPPRGVTTQRAKGSVHIRARWGD